MWVKICGTTSLKDALLAAEAGADAVGYVLAPSPRRVDAEQVAAMAPELPEDLTQVGVVQSQDAGEIAQWVRTAGLHGVQLHGGLNPDLLQRLRGEFGYKLFLVQALHWRVDGEAEEAERQLRADVRAVVGQGVADAVLIDARTARASGGTGKTIDWKRARQVVEAEGPKLRVIVAGGLKPENVAEAIRTMRPWGVDVASGVEASPGSKDPARVREFLRMAREAFAEIEKPAGPRYVG